MPDTCTPLKLSPEEERFLRHWMYDEVHYQEGIGQAKRLQLQHRALPADLATLIAAAMPDLAMQQAAGSSPPQGESPTWPWTAERLNARIAEAHSALLETRRQSI